MRLQQRERLRARSGNSLRPGRRGCAARSPAWSPRSARPRRCRRWRPGCRARRTRARRTRCRRDRCLVGDVHPVWRDAVAAETAARARPRPRASASPSSRRAPRRRRRASSRSAIALPMPPAPPVIRAMRPASGAGWRQAAQLGLLQRPILDVERFLLRQAEIAADRLGAAHDVDGVAIELGGDPRGRLVLGEGEHAEPGMQHDHRIGVAHARDWPARGSARSRRVVVAVGVERLGQTGVTVCSSRRRIEQQRRGSWCAGSGRGTRCRSAASRAASR